ncbi:MAG TPA: asparaginase [Vicinamibacteria bacterium]|nr:asparaginase [Vicinamibacteria bacterium]
MLALFAAPLSSAAPKVHLLGTGGTIAGGSGGSLGAGELASLLANVAGVAEVSVEDFSNIGSSRMTPELQFRLAERVSSLFEERTDLSGIVITHGTDSLEETAFLVDLVVPPGKPVVFAAAQRPPRDTDTDGPRNLLNAIRIASHPGTGGLGVLVTLNDEMHAARDVRKTHAVALNAFVSPWVGPIGHVDSERVYLFHRPARLLTIAASRIEPRVDLITLYAGSDGGAIRNAVRSGAQGLVVEVFGRGNVPPEAMAAVAEAREKGVTVAFSSRTGGGRVELGEDAKQAGVLSAEDLDGLKARIVLIVALGAGADAARIADYYRRLSGELAPPLHSQ